VCDRRDLYTFVYADEDTSDQIGTSVYRYDGSKCNLKSNGTTVTDDAYKLEDEEDSDHERKLIVNASS